MWARKGTRAACPISKAWAKRIQMMKCNYRDRWLSMKHWMTRLRGRICKLCPKTLFSQFLWGMPFKYSTRWVMEEPILQTHWLVNSSNRTTFSITSTSQPCPKVSHHSTVPPKHLQLSKWMNRGSPTTTNFRLQQTFRRASKPLEHLPSDQTWDQEPLVPHPTRSEERQALVTHSQLWSDRFKT